VKRIDLRAYIFLDRLQPQVAGLLGAAAPGAAPEAGEAALLVEIAPGLIIHRLLDTALKATSCRPAFKEVEREYGLMILHDPDQGQVMAAGDAILDYLGLTVEERLRPHITVNEVVRGVEPDHTRWLNRGRGGSLVEPGESLFLLETRPAACLALSANEAEKMTSIKVIELNTLGAYGRLMLSGAESEIDSAAQAAVSVLESMSGISVMSG
jgi:hypothetical protein